MSQAAALEPLIPALRRYAFALTRDHHAADDLVQDTLERALGRWMLRGAEKDLRAWLFAILHNRFIDLQRVRSRRPLHGTLDEEVEAATTSPTQDSGLLGRDLLAQFSALSPEHQAVLLLVGVEGMAYAGVAQVLDIPVGTVMSRLSRARAQFRRLLDGERLPARPDLRRVK